MSFDREALEQAVGLHGRVARVVIASVAGSAPRAVGTAMLVWAEGQSSTIGGGTLEYEAAARARAMLERGAARVDRVPLGPGLGQCCGGAVVLVTEVFDAGRLAALADGPVIARRVSGSAEMPLGVSRILARTRGEGVLPDTALIDGWLVEPVSRPHRDLWIWGAGHVGRAIVGVMAPLPDFALTWVDMGHERFPAEMPEGVTQLIATNPANLVPHAPRDAEHLILTYSHALDLELCHRLLGHGFAHAGLIGSATKWARFRSRLRALGHPPAKISRIICPIGDPILGKHPQAIALGAAAAILAMTGRPPQSGAERGDLDDGTAVHRRADQGVSGCRRQ